MTRRTIPALMGLVLLAGGSLIGAGSPAVGTWDCVAGTPDGDLNWTLSITEKEGTLAGSVSGDPGEFQLAEVNFGEGSLTFKVTIGEVTYSVKVGIEKDKLDGNWEGGDASGTMTGTRRV